MQTETEDSFERAARTREAWERGFESKESPETQPDEELKAAAAMERADLLVREVKSSRQQMNNIIVHMREVIKAIRELRAQLQIAQPVDGGSDHDIPASSLEQDQRRVEQLKRKIARYKTELLNMKDDLIREQAEVLKSERGTVLTEESLKKQAKEMVEELLRETGIT